SAPLPGDVAASLRGGEGGALPRWCCAGLRDQLRDPVAGRTPRGCGAASTATPDSPVGALFPAGEALRIYLVATLAMLVVCARRSGIVASLAFVGTLCLFGFLPQSNELRYYMFIPVTWAAAIGMLFPQFRASFPPAGLALLVLVLALFSTWTPRMRRTTKSRGSITPRPRVNGAPRDGGHSSNEARRTARLTWCRSASC